MVARFAGFAVVGGLMLGCTSLAGLDGDYTLGSTTASAGGGTSVSVGGGAASSSGSMAGGAGGAGLGGAGGSVGMGGAGGAGPTWVVIDKLTVECNTAQSVTSLVSLTMGETYRLRASGSCIVTASGTECDAEWMDFNNPHTLDNSSTVDMGIGIDDPVNDTMKRPDWGAYDSTHVYTVDFVGKGGPIQANLHDPDNSNDSGTLSVEILRFQ